RPLVHRGGEKPGAVAAGPRGRRRGGERPRRRRPPPHIHLTGGGGVPPPRAPQIVQGDRHAEFCPPLAIIAASLEKVATEIRSLQRTEILEAEEPFTEGQKGSSATPHKRHHVSVEQVCGRARLVRTNSLAALENVALWHERDISHSSVERVILPDSTLLVDYMLHQMTRIVEGLQVYPERMRENMERSFGLMFSQRVLLRLAETGLPRQQGYA